MNNEPTPRCDESSLHANDHDGFCVPLRIAEQLERELLAAKREIESCFQLEPLTIRVCEGGGPENIYATLALTMANVRQTLIETQLGREALKSALKVAAKLLASNDCLCWGKCETQVERDYICDKCTALSNPIIQQALKEE